MAEQIVSSNNIFVDTGRGDSTGLSKGDDFTIHLNTQGLNADRGQYLRITLQEFSMYKTWTDVNENNNKVITRYSGGTTAVSAIELSKQNYSTLSDLAEEFAEKIGKDIITNVGAVSSITSVSLPANTTSITGTTDNIIKITITCNANHGLTDLKLQCYEGKGDSYALLGGNRINDGNDITTNSFTVDVSQPTKVIITGYYPAQRSTTPYIYLRTNLNTNAIETSSLSSPTDQKFMEDTNPSNILAKIAVNTEFCVFSTSTGREFFLNLHQKHIQTIELYLTDERNRRLGRTTEEWNLNTASGSGTQQSILGNLSFSSVLKVDVVQFQQPNELLKPAPANSLPARYSNLMLSP